MDVVKILEPYALDREQEVHTEALQTWGEKIVIRRIWTVEDYEAGAVSRCPDCHAGGTAAIQARVKDVYQQAGDSWCSACYGVGFEGGFEPTIYISWMLAQEVPQDEQRQRFGVHFPEQPRVQFPWDPPLDEGDLVVRVATWTNDTTPATEMDRFTCQEIERVTVRTGPLPPQDSILVAQQASITKLPEEHPYRGVAVTTP